MFYLPKCSWKPSLLPYVFGLVSNKQTTNHYKTASVISAIVSITENTKRALKSSTMFHDLNPLLSKGFLLRQIIQFDSDSRGNREPQKTFEQERHTVRETPLKRRTDKGNALRDFPGSLARV